MTAAYTSANPQQLSSRWSTPAMRLLDISAMVLTADIAYAISCGVPDEISTIVTLNIAAISYAAALKFTLNVSTYNSLHA
jgi:hypothetical protein